MVLTGQLHTLNSILLEKEPHYTLDRRLDGSQSQSGHGGKWTNF